MRMLRVSLCALLFVCSSAFGATKSWTGAVSNFWSVGGNWSGGVAPVNGDDLVFPNGANTFSLNDISGISISGINITGASYLLSGSAITLTGNVQMNPNNTVWNMPTTLAAPVTITNGFTTYMNSFTLGGNTLTLASGSPLFDGTIGGTGNVVINNSSNMLLRGAINITGGVTVTGGAALTVQGSIAAMSLTAGPTATLRGDGTIPATSLVSPATLEVGPNSCCVRGILTVNGNFTAVSGTTAQFDLVTPTPGSGHDQLVVNGTVSLTGSTLQVLLPGTLPGAGQTFVIVANDGADPVVGAFAGLAEGATFSVSGVTFQISYVGGTGNDVVLTVLSAPKAWTGAVNNFWSIGGNWSGGVPPVNGDFLVFPNGANTFSLNDISGISISGISVTGPSYLLSGSAITLTGNVQMNPNNTVWNMPTTVAAPVTITNGFTTYMNSFTLGGNTLTLASGSPLFDGTIGGTGNVVINNSSNMLLRGAINITGGVTVTGGAALTVQGSIAATSLTAGPNATLRGDGTIPATTLVSPSTLEVGPNSCCVRGILTANGNFSAVSGTTTAFELVNPTPGSGHDQLVVNGVVTLTNPTLQVTLPGPFPSPGQSFVIIANDGADPVVGTFNGLAQGGTFLVGGTTFQISYTGGTGNDVVLTVLSAAKAWIGGVSNFWSVGANWTGGVAPVNGDLLVFPNGANTFTLNDLSGISIAGINVIGPSYLLSGLPITLTGDVQLNSNNVTWNMPTTLAAPVTFTGGTVFQSSIALGGNTLTFGSSNTLYDGTITGTGNVVITNSSNMLLRGAINITGGVTVTGGSTLTVQGSIAATSLTAGPNATLRGNGTIPTTTLVSPATLAVGPNVSPFLGILTANGSFTAVNGTTMQFELVNPTPGSGHDQLVVNGTVTLGSSTLQVLLPGTLPALGQTFVIIANDGVDPVIGTFAGLAEGSTITVGSVIFRVSYIGGTGNDVVLTVVPTPATAAEVPTLSEWMLLLLACALAIAAARMVTKG